MEIVEFVKAVPPQSLGLGLALYLIYKLIEWWRTDLRAVVETLNNLINTVTRLTVLMEIQKDRKDRKARGEDE